MTYKKYFIIIAFLTTAANADIASKNYADDIASALSEQINTKATDNNVVHKSGNETITGEKTFSDTITSTKDGYILNSDTISIRNNSNPFIGLFPNGSSGGVNFYLQATGNTMYLGPTATHAMSFDHDTGNISAPNKLTVVDAITTNTDVPESEDSNRVATTKWTNNKIDATRSTIRNGSATATEFAEIWVE